MFVTDHQPLIALAKASTSANSKLARWSAKLAQYSHAVVSYRAGVCLGLSDTLSRLIYPAKEETPDTRKSLEVDHQGFAPLENVDTEEGKARRLLGLPFQRLSMLTPPTGACWVDAKRAYQQATDLGDVKTQLPVMHGDDPLAEARVQEKDGFCKHQDWFQSGMVSATQAAKIMRHAMDTGQMAALTEAELGNGSYYISKCLDTRPLDRALESGDGDVGNVDCVGSIDVLPPDEEDRRADQRLREQGLT